MKTMKAVLIWLLVIIPLTWGVTQSVKKAMPLFQGGIAVGKP
jgi:hypothetical protein